MRNLDLENLNSEENILLTKIKEQLSQYDAKLRIISFDEIFVDDTETNIYINASTLINGEYKRSFFHFENPIKDKKDPWYALRYSSSKIDYEFAPISNKIGIINYLGFEKGKSTYVYGKNIFTDEMKSSYNNENEPQRLGFTLDKIRGEEVAVIIVKFLDSYFSFIINKFGKIVSPIYDSISQSFIETSSEEFDISKFSIDFYQRIDELRKKVNDRQKALYTKAFHLNHKEDCDINDFEQLEANDIKLVEKIKKALITSLRWNELAKINIDTAYQNDSGDIFTNLQVYYGTNITPAKYFMHFTKNDTNLELKSMSNNYGFMPISNNLMILVPFFEYSFVQKFKWVGVSYEGYRSREKNPNVVILGSKLPNNSSDVTSFAFSKELGEEVALVTLKSHEEEGSLNQEGFTLSFLINKKGERISAFYNSITDSYTLGDDEGFNVNEYIENFYRDAAQLTASETKNGLFNKIYLPKTRKENKAIEIDLKSKENKKFLKSIFKFIKKEKDWYIMAITKAYIDQQGNVLINTTSSVPGEFFSSQAIFYHFKQNNEVGLSLIGECCGTFTYISEGLGRVDDTVTYPHCNYNCYIYDVENSEAVIFLSSLEEFETDESTGTMIARATRNITGDFHAILKINASGKPATPIASNINDSLINSNSPGFNFEACINGLREEALEKLNVRGSKKSPNPPIMKLAPKD